MLHELRRNEEARVLEARNALERHPHHLVILDDRTAAVARIDGGIGLNRQVGPVPGVDVACISTRDTTPRV